MTEKIIDPSTLAVFSKEEEYKFIEYLRNLAYSIASRYKGKEERLRKAALQGLPDAIRLFKKEYVNKYKFSTYATWFMKESVEKELEKENKA